MGVIQTLPSMALLVLMIPFFGLGAWPAIVTMFLYTAVRFGLFLPTTRSGHILRRDAGQK